MKSGLSRFEFYLKKLDDLLQQSRKEMNPALWLYNNDARTTIFMLEGLAKLYAGLFNKKRFGKIKEELKLLEDGLGAIDYYDSFAREFMGNHNIPEGIIAYMQAQAREKIQHLNDLLQERNWMGENADRLQKIRKKLKDADWLKDEKEMTAIAAFYKNAIDEIKNFAAETKYHFTEIETQVHELRRKIRWLSIYPKALQGAIQLTDSKIPDESVVKYLTEAVINSPFNKMPDAGSNEHILLLERNYFLAMSWMIAELGKIKDNGLRIVAVAEAFQQTKGIGNPESLAWAYHVLGDQQPKIIDLLSQSSAICESYFKEKHLDKLVSGIVQ